MRAYDIYDCGSKFDNVEYNIGKNNKQSLVTTFQSFIVISYLK